MSELQPLNTEPNETYRHLVQNMPIMLWTADHLGRWTHVNRRWSDYTGLIGEASGFGFEEALHPDDVGPTVKVWRHAVATAHDYDIEYRIRNVSGEYRWFLTQGRKTPGEPDAQMTWVGSCTDVQAQRQAEEQAQHARLAAIRALGLALEARDRETQGHTDRVTLLAGRLGETLQLNEDERADLQLGAFLHDVGKIAVPDAILLKPGALNASERLEINTHAIKGEQFARALEQLPERALALIRHHHERWDGRGYPDGLRGTAIPLLARLFSVVDTFDALVSERPYKRAWPLTDALGEIRREAGHQFDPDIVSSFLRLFSNDKSGETGGNRGGEPPTR